MDSDHERYVLPGRNNRFTEIAAAMGISQLRCVPGFLEIRRRIAALYDRLLIPSDLFRPVQPGAGSVPSYWRYVLTPKVPLEREHLRECLASDGISIDWAYDPPLHLQPVFRDLLATQPGMLPRSENLLSKHFCLPIHARLRPEDAEYAGARLLHHCSQLIDRMRIAK